MVRLLGRFTSINVRKAAWLLDEIGMDWQHEDWGAGLGPLQTPEFLALNPRALVPVLVDGDFVLTESQAILRYLSAKHGRDDLYPVDLEARACVEEWLDIMATEITPALGYAFRALGRKVPGFDDAARIEESRRNWNRQMGFVEAQLTTTGAFITGHSFTLADIAIGLAVNRWMRVPMEKPALPAARAYLTRLGERPAARRYMGEGTD